MIFEPAPPNDFAEFINTYYERCRRVVPEIEAIGGKWEFEDLLPGMSDFDYRFIYADGMTAADWCRAADAVGEVHLELCVSQPDWARKLEHLPGGNLTWEELSNPTGYCPEYRQWHFYHTAAPDRLKDVEDGFAARGWSEADERYHLGKFLAYYGPYDRELNPAINLGSYESKYPLHSRLMHYLPPPVQSAISILRQETLVGKLEALRLACDMFPETSVFAEALDIIGRHYEVGALYEDPALAQLEQRLLEGIQTVGRHLADAITILPDAVRTGPEQWRDALNDLPVDLGRTVFDSIKWARLTKGRFYFYVNAPSFFDTTWLIQSELDRLGELFFRTPLCAFWELTTGEKTDNPVEIVPRLAPDILPQEEVECVLTVVSISTGRQEGNALELARQAVEVFNGFYHALHKIAETALQT